MKSIHFEGDGDLYKRLQLLAKRENTTIKRLYNDFMEDYLKKHEEGNPQHLITSSMDNEDFIGFPSMATDYDKKKAYIMKNCVIKDVYGGYRLNPLGLELWSHTTQWYNILKEY